MVGLPTAQGRAAAEVVEQTVHRPESPARCVFAPTDDYAIVDVAAPQA